MRKFDFKIELQDSKTNRHMKPGLTLNIYCLGLLLSMPYYATGGDTMSFVVKSPDFQEGSAIPRTFTCEGEDTSPELLWEDPPPGTKSLSLIVEDPDAPMGTFIHWVVYDIPASVNGLKRGAGNDSTLPHGAKHGSTGFGANKYGGPCPPKGHGRHRYNFILRALDTDTLELRTGASKTEVERAMRGHVLAEAKTTGVYQR